MFCLRVGGRSPMYSMCAGVCSSLVPSLGCGGMSLWLYESGEVWLFVMSLVWLNLMWVQHIVWRMCCGKVWVIGRFVVIVCNCVSMVWIMLACMHLRVVRCGFVHEVWRCPSVPGVGLFVGRQKGHFYLLCWLVTWD